ncbi:hypothetical protein [Amycolatopsis acidicola]|uniref:hypothetical protein n=1 Tax=Amycolatopsis acidicola TaxID=2596893 RepID=UPI001AA0391E|nr:hypothetical protein [Amycolatopsis acidicola]
MNRTPACRNTRVTASADAGSTAKAAVRADAVEARDSIQALAIGAREVADGNAQLASKPAELAPGIAAAASGPRQPDSGVQQASTGARKLATGAGQPDNGAKEVDDGAHDLATQPDKGRDQVPGYTDAERAHLKTVAADPSTATTGDTSIGTLALTLFAAPASWAPALASYIVTRAVPGAVLTVREPTRRIILRPAIPGTTAAALATLAITVIADPVLKRGFAGSGGFLSIALLAASAFVALNQANRPWSPLIPA